MVAEEDEPAAGEDDDFGVEAPVAAAAAAAPEEEDIERDIFRFASQDTVRGGYRFVSNPRQAD